MLWTPRGLQRSQHCSVTWWKLNLQHNSWYSILRRRTPQGRFSPVRLTCSQSLWSQQLTVERITISSYSCPTWGHAIFLRRRIIPVLLPVRKKAIQIFCNDKLCFVSSIWNKTIFSTEIIMLWNSCEIYISLALISSLFCRLWSKACYPMRIWVDTHPDRMPKEAILKGQKPFLSCHCVLQHNYWEGWKGQFNIQCELCFYGVKPQSKHGPSSHLGDSRESTWKERRTSDDRVYVPLTPPVP